MSSRLSLRRMVEKRKLMSEKRNRETIYSVGIVSIFLPRDALVHSAVLRLHVVRLSVRLDNWQWESVCSVGQSCGTKTL